MRYVIIGAGAIGGVLGGRLEQHGRNPLLIARGENGRVISSAGLRLRSPDDDSVVRVPVAETPQAVHLQRDDVLVFATKTQSLDGAVREWADQPVHEAGRPVGTAGELLPAFIALNGIEGERIALRYFDHVHPVCVWLPGVHLTPGEVIVRIGPSSGTFLVGPSLGGGTLDDPVLIALKRDFEAASFRVFLEPDADAWKRRKLLSNLGNAVQALVGPSGDDETFRLLRAEAKGVYDLLGLTIPSGEAERERRGNAFDIREVPGTGDLGGSTWQSMKRGGSLETDYLNGEIALMAKLAGTSAPLNAAVQRLARTADGTMSVERLREFLRPLADA